MLCKAVGGQISEQLTLDQIGHLIYATGYELDKLQISLYFMMIDGWPQDSVPLDHFVS